MGHKHSRELLLHAALHVAQSDGLHKVTFGRVAAAAGVSDRIVVYYFPNKTALLSAVLDAIGDVLQAGLGDALAGSRPTTHKQLVTLAWPVLAAEEARAFAALYIEALGLAAAGVSPYAELAASVIATWEQWLTEVFQGSTARQQGEAAAALALIDGLLMVLLAAGPEIAHRAAQALGVATGPHT